MKRKLHVRTNDMVQVTAGDSKGARGRILRAMPQENKVIVEGVNTVWKHVKPSREQPRGGRIEIEAPLDASNVMLLCQNRECEKHDRPVRSRTERDEGGAKNRVCVHCGHPIVTQE